jgi:hypothetical protein
MREILNSDRQGAQVFLHRQLIIANTSTSRPQRLTCTYQFTPFQLSQSRRDRLRSASLFQIVLEISLAVPYGVPPSAAFGPPRYASGLPR